MNVSVQTARGGGPFTNAKNFGATGNGSTDDTTALQSAITAAQTSGVSVYIPAGSYVISSALNVTSPIRIFGDGHRETIILPGSTTTAFAIDTSAGPIFEDFCISYGTAQTTNQAINVTCTGGECNGFIAQRLRTVKAYVAINLVRASYYIITECQLIDSASRHIVCANANNVDSGDGVITNNTLFNPTVTGGINAVYWTSGGGLRFTNNKINNAQYGLVIGLASGATTGIILVEGNSIEAVGFPSVGNGIHALRLGSTGTLHSLLIEGNELNGWANGVIVDVDANGSWVTGITVTGNSIKNSSAFTGVKLNALTNFVVSHNSLTSNSSSSAAFNFGSTADHGILGPNMKTGTWGANTVSSTNTTTIAPN